MKQKKIATIKNGNAAITVYYNPYANGGEAEYWDCIITEGNALMKDQFDLFLKVNILNIIQYFPYEWGRCLRLSSMFAEAYGYEITKDILIKLENS